jgi:hypothetical protein
MKLFDECVDDSHNRVAGNALVGLHIGGRENAIEQILEMSHDWRPDRRITSAWAMGRLATDCFAGRLAEMIRDEDPGVRGMALRALVLIRKTSPVPADPKEQDVEAVEAAVPEDPISAQEPDLVTAIDVRLDGRNFRAS